MPQKLKKLRAFSKPQLTIFILAFALIGYLIYRSFAAAPLVASLEAEQMSLPAGAAVITDSTASGGKALKMTSTGTSIGSVNFPSSVTSVTVMAKGDQCSGAPVMSVSLDSNVVLNSISISATSWTAYSVSTAAISSGTHNLYISFDNAYTSSGHGKKKNGSCSRALYADVSYFYGPSTVTPAPTVTLSASPTSVTAGQSSTLTWGSTNANSCAASGAWSGSEPTSGSASTGALNQNSTYTLTCTGDGGSASAGATVSVSGGTTGSVLYSKNWEDGQIDSGGWQHQAIDNLGCPFSDNICYGTITAENSNADTGTWAGKLSLPANTTNKQAVTITHSRTVQNPSDEWFSTALYFPTSWPQMLTDTSGATHSLTLLCPNYYSVNSCMVNIEATGDSMYTLVNTGACPTSDQGGGCPYYSGSTDFPGICRGFPNLPCAPWYFVQPGQLKLNTWYEIILHVYYTLDTNGVVQVYARTKGQPNWTLALDHSGGFPTLQTGPTAFGTTVTSSNINGWNSNDYINAYRFQSSSPLTVYQDNFCRATTFSAAASCFE